MTTYEQAAATELARRDYQALLDKGEFVRTFPNYKFISDAWRSEIRRLARQDRISIRTGAYEVGGYHCTVLAYLSKVLNEPYEPKRENAERLTLALSGDAPNALEKRYLEQMREWTDLIQEDEDAQ